MHAMLEKEGFLSEAEMDMYRRGRNSKSHTIAKKCGRNDLPHRDRLRVADGLSASFRAKSSA